MYYFFTFLLEGRIYGVIIIIIGGWTYVLLMSINDTTNNTVTVLNTITDVYTINTRYTYIDFQDFYFFVPGTKLTNRITWENVDLDLEMPLVSREKSDYIAQLITVEADPL